MNIKMGIISLLLKWPARLGWDVNVHYVSNDWVDGLICNCISMSCFSTRYPEGHQMVGKSKWDFYQELPGRSFIIMAVFR